MVKNTKTPREMSEMLWPGNLTGKPPNRTCSLPTEHVQMVLIRK
jgi:hypothetical protein